MISKGIVLIGLSFCSLISNGQQGKFNPFKLIVLKPDTAIIDKSLRIDIDSVQSDYINRYYHSIQEMEELINFKNFPDDTIFKKEQQKIKQELITAKMKEPEIKKFKFYQTLSTYSTEVYKFYFNQYEPFSIIIELPYQKTDIISLKKLADTSKADYIVFFSNIHTEKKEDQQILKLTTSLYSKKDNKIILTKITEGDTESRGDMWTCGTILSCILINGVRTSTEEVVPIIVKRQIKH